MPIVKNKNSDGYLRIVGLQKKYGFSDQVYEFDTPAAAKKYVSDTMRTKSNGKRKGLERYEVELYIAQQFCGAGSRLRKCFFTV